MILGDFNSYLDPRLDRHPPVQPPLGGRGTILSCLLMEVGWTDVWQLKYPTTKQFSCFSKTHGSVSRIELCVGSSHILNLVNKVGYFPREISDHFPMVVHLITCLAVSLLRAPSKLNAFWLKLFSSHERVVKKIEGFFHNNQSYLNVSMKWDTIKACLRGTFMAEIEAVKHNSSALLERVEDQVRQLDLSYVTDPSDSVREAWIPGQDSLDRLSSSAAERKHYFSKQAFYGDGEKTGRLLARIARSQQSSAAIRAIRCSTGRLVNAPQLIITELASFYADLKRPCDDHPDKALKGYLETISLPVLTRHAHLELKAPFMLDELEEAVL